MGQGQAEGKTATSTPSANGGDGDKQPKEVVRFRVIDPTWDALIGPHSDKIREEPRVEPEKGVVRPPYIPSDEHRGRKTNLLDFLYRKVIKILLMKCALPFKDPVDADKLEIPMYHKIIKRPMDLTTIKKRLENQYYLNAAECLNDLKTVFVNCFTYNHEGTFVCEDGKKLEKSLLEKIKHIRLEDEHELSPSKGRGRSSKRRENGGRRDQKSPSKANSSISRSSGPESTDKSHKFSSSSPEGRKGKRMSRGRSDEEAESDRRTRSRSASRRLQAHSPRNSSTKQLLQATIEEMEKEVKKTKKDEDRKPSIELKEIQEQLKALRNKLKRIQAADHGSSGTEENRRRGRPRKSDEGHGSSETEIKKSKGRPGRPRKSEEDRSSSETETKKSKGKPGRPRKSEEDHGSRGTETKKSKGRPGRPRKRANDPGVRSASESSENQPYVRKRSYRPGGKKSEATIPEVVEIEESESANEDANKETSQSDPSFVGGTAPDKSPAPPKPADAANGTVIVVEDDDDTTPMSKEEKWQLLRDVEQLNDISGAHMYRIIQIVRRKDPEFLDKNPGDEIALDFEDMPAVTLREIERYVTNCKNSATNKSKKRGRKPGTKNKNTKTTPEELQKKLDVVDSCLGEAHKTTAKAKETKKNTKVNGTASPRKSSPSSSSSSSSSCSSSSSSSSDSSSDSSDDEGGKKQPKKPAEGKKLNLLNSLKPKELPKQHSTLASDLKLSDSSDSDDAKGSKEHSSRAVNGGVNATSAKSPMKSSEKETTLSDSDEEAEIRQSEPISLLKSAAVSSGTTSAAPKPAIPKERFDMFKHLAKSKAERERLAEEQKQKIEAAVLEPVKRQRAREREEENQKRRKMANMAEDTFENELLTGFNEWD